MDVPQKLPDGRWRVGDKVFATNAKAWRWIDREENEPVSRAEDVSDWAFNQSINREFG